MWHCVLVIAICVSVVSGQGGFPVESTFVNTYLAPSANPALGNQTVEWQQNSLTFQCSSTDQEDPNLQVGNTCYDITCNAPEYPYDVTLRGFVPQSGHLYSVEICLVGSQSTLAGQNQTAIPPPTPPDIPAGRRLLSIFDTISNAFDNYVGGVVCTASLGFAGNCDNQGGGGMDPAVRDALINQAQKLNYYISNMTVWQTATSNTLSDLSTVNQGITATLQNQQSQLNTVQQFGTQLNNTVYALAYHTDQLASQVNLDFQNVYRNLSLLGTSLTQTDNTVQKLQNALIYNFQSLTNTTTRMQVNQNNQNIQFFQKIHAVTRMVKVLASAVRTQALQTNLQNAITAGIFGQAAVAHAAGEVLLVHPKYPGQAPAANFPDTLLKQTLDKMYLSFVNASGGQNINHQIGINIYCNLDRLQLYSFDAIDYEDVFDLIGPAGCTAGGSTAALANCLCWIEITHSYCQVRTGFRWDSLTSQNRADYQLQQAYCLNGNTVPTVDSVWNGRLFDLMTNFNTQILGPTCALTLSSAIPALQFNLYSARVGVMNMIQTPFYQVAAVCPVDVYVVFESLQYANTMPFNVIRTITVAYSAMFTDDNPVLQYEYGFPPDYVTVTPLSLRLMPNNQTAQCYRASIMGLSPFTKPVFTIVPTPGLPVVTSVTVVAKDCSSGDIISSNIVSTGITADVPTLGSLLPSGFTIFDIIQPAGFLPPTSNVYDYLLGEANVGGPRQSRAGHLTYPMQPIPSGFDITNTLQSFPPTAMMDVQIALDNGALFFNHEDAAFTIDQVEVPFTFNSGAGQQVCVPPTGHVVGPLCTFLSDFTLQNPLTNFRNGKMYAVANDWTLTVVADVAMGEVVQRVYPGCAEISFATYQNNQISYTLTNSLPNEITAIVVLASTSGLCPNLGSSPIDLLPKQIYTKTIPTCGNMTLQVFQPKLPGPGQLACTPPFSLTVNPNSQANLPPNTNDVNITYVQDTFVQQTTAVILAAASLFTDLAPLLTPVLTPNLTTIERSDLITSALLNFIAQAQQFSNANFVGNETAIDIYKQYLPALNNISATFHQQAVVGQALINNLTAENRKVQADVAQVKIDLNNTIYAQKQLTIADNNLIAALNAITDGSTSIEPCPDCPHIPFIYQLCCAIINIAQFLANILLYVAIIFAIVSAAYGIYRLIRYCQAKRNEEAADQETEQLVHNTKLQQAKATSASTEMTPLEGTSGPFSLRRTRHAN